MIIYKILSHGIPNIEETVKVINFNLIFRNKVRSSINDLKTTQMILKHPKSQRKQRKKNDEEKEDEAEK